MVDNFQCAQIVIAGAEVLALNQQYLILGRGRCEGLSGFVFVRFNDKNYN